MIIRTVIVISLVVGLCACNTRHPKELELRRSFRNYLFAIEELHEEGIEQYVFFPGVRPGRYKDHVRKLLTEYLTYGPAGVVNFDDQGVVLSRFLKMTYHNYEVLEVTELDERDYEMRLAFAFNYDSLLERADYEEGTVVMIPGDPLGRVNVYEVGAANEIPRKQLTYLEVKVVLRRTQYEEYYQIREVTPIQSSARFEESFRG